MNSKPRVAIREPQFCRTSALLLDMANYRLDTALEELPANSFRPEGREERIRTMVRKDVGVNGLPIEALLNNAAMHFTFPVSVLV